MGLLDRFSSPIWYRASKLPKDRQYALAVVISGYDFLCNAVREQLIPPLKSVLERGDMLRNAGNKRLTPEITQQLVEEALVGLLRCCSVPCADPSGKLSSVFLEALPQVWGTFVLADINHRLGRSAPNVLEQTGYSSDPDEARTQLLVKWMATLGVESPSFVVELNLKGFASAWKLLAGHFVQGTLKGISRTPVEVVLSKARRVAAQIPPHRAALMEYIIERGRMA